MSRQIPERDWKVFKELRPVALARLCDRILVEARVELDRPDQSSHEKYLNLFALIKGRDKDVAQGFNDFRRSTALIYLGVIQSMDLLTPEDLRRFSPETQSYLAMLREPRSD